MRRSTNLLGRIGSYAGLVYAGDTSDPARGKFYGDTQEKLTAATSDLLFFELELNRLDDGALDEALAAGPLAHYRPWIEDIRKGKPYQLDDRLEQLFHEKSVTGYSAWNRLFDETIAALRFKVDGQSLAIEPTLNLLQDPKEETREKAAQGAWRGVQGQSAPVRADHQHAGQGQGNFRPLARLRRCRRFAPSLQPRRARGGRCAGRSAVRAAYPRLSHRYYTLKAQMVRQEPALKFWDRNAPLPDVPTKTFSWAEARSAVLGAYGAFSPKMAGIAERFFDERWIDAPVRPGKAPGAFAHPTVPSAHPYVLLNYQGKPRDVMTLAHELGHGVHQVLAAPNGALMAPTPLTLAETACVFGEMLTFRALLAEDRRQ